MLGVTSNPLTRASRSFDNWVDRFEMARICRKTNFHLRAGCEFSHGPIAEMIFHVAIAGDELRNVILAELGENNAERFLQKRSEEHTSELQYRCISYAVFCLKKKKIYIQLAPITI